MQVPEDVAEKMRIVREKLSSIYPEQLIQVARFIAETTQIHSKVAQDYIRNYDEALLFLTWYHVKTSEAKEHILKEHQQARRSFEQFVATELASHVPPGNAA